MSTPAERARTKHLLVKYGITDEQYAAMLAAQGGVCAICLNPPTNRRLPVDHDHKSRMVRGVLCHWCNHRLLSGARDSVERLRAAIAYLESPPAVAVIGEVLAPKKKRKRKEPKPC